MAEGSAFVALGWDIIRDLLALCSLKFLDYLRFLPYAEIIPSFSMCTCCNSSDYIAQQMLLPQYGLI